MPRRRIGKDAGKEFGEIKGAGGADKTPPSIEIPPAMTYRCGINIFISHSRWNEACQARRTKARPMIGCACYEYTS